jgi:integrase
MIGMKLVWKRTGFVLHGGLMERKKNQQGTVAVETYKDRLRLRWGHQGQRYCLALGMPDTKVNRIVAEGKAKIIEGDLVTSNFDPTLAKYKPELAHQAATIKVPDLLEKFIQYKQKVLFSRSLDKYKALKKPLTEFFEGRSAASINEDKADEFRLWLSKSLAPATQKERLTSLNACWTWAIKQKLVTTANPWAEVLKRVKVPPNQRPRPFTKSEIQALLAGFKNDPYYQHYTDFVEFLLTTGCRTGEVIGLQWKHLPQDCSTVWIGESMARGKIRKATKTNRARQFRLTSRAQAMLLNRRPPNFALEDLVFPSPRGGVIDDHNFRNRAWTSVLKAAGIDYRCPYNTRHTMISHSLAKGINPVTIAEMVGHDPEVLFKHYAADIQGGLQLPDLLDDLPG